MPRLPDLQPLIISAPFGNYVQPRGATATLGTFTAMPRPGRLWRILKTLRYYPRLRAWVNRIGLRNPGIDWLVQRVQAQRLRPDDKLVSVHGFSPDDWWRLLDRLSPLKPLGVELNMSCPNVGEIDFPPELFHRAMGTGMRVVVKLPPVNWQGIERLAFDAGVRVFHACNTLPVPAGGMSGKPLKPVAMGVVAAVRALRGEAVTIIGGGGITAPGDIDDYRHVGADHVAIGTKAMDPRLLWTDKPLRPLLDRAAGLK